MLIAELLLVDSIADIIEPVLLFLEQDKNFIFDVHETYTKMLHKLVGQISKPSSTVYNEIIKNKKVDAGKLNHNDAFLSEAISKSLKINQVGIFKLKINQMFVKIISYLFEKKFFGDFLYFVHFMNIENFFHENAILFAFRNIFQRNNL